MTLKGQTRLSNFPLFLFFLLLVGSCTTNRKITYFRDIPDSLGGGSKSIALAAFSEPVIKANDILHVSVQTLDAASTSIMGVTTSSTFSTQSSTGQQSIIGYLVDKEGYIEIPLVGRLNVSGLTTVEAKEAIRKKAMIYYKDPVVNVRFANFEITVLGEVNAPAKYVAPGERVTILDALGMAGDLTVYGRRENVLLIREDNGQKTVVRFNLNSSHIFQSPYFYLRQGDVVYVEPNKSKLAATDAAKTRTYTLVISAVSALLVVLSRVNF